MKFSGGDIAEGKTSNMELDDIYRRYLPPGVTLPCDTMPHFSAARARELGINIKSGKQPTTDSGHVFFPLFIRQHWIAGVLSLQPAPSNNIVLTLHDSAPSHAVHYDVTRLFSEFWPELVIRTGSCPHQRRGSEDCGLFMTAIFFSKFLNVPIIHGNSLGKRLRFFLCELEREDLSVPKFRDKMSDALTNRDFSSTAQRRQPRPPTASIEGGASNNGNDDSADSGDEDVFPIPPRKKRRTNPQEQGVNNVSARTAQAPARTRTKAAPSVVPTAKKASMPKARVNNNDNDITTRGQAYDPFLSSGGDEAMTATVRGTASRATSPEIPARHSSASPHVSAHDSPSGAPRSHASEHTTAATPQSITDKVGAMFSEVSANADETKKRHLGFFAAATALANVGDGGSRTLSWHSLSTQASRLGFRVSVPYDIGDALAVFKKPLDFLPAAAAAAGIGDLPRSPARVLASALLARPQAPWSPTPHAVLGPPATGAEEQRDSTTSAIYLQAASAQTGLPKTIAQDSTSRHGGREWGFRLGARLIPETSDGDEGPRGLAVAWRVVLTSKPQEAVIGVYLPSDITLYPAAWTSKMRRLRGQRVTVDAVPDEWANAADFAKYYRRDHHERGRIDTNEVQDEHQHQHQRQQQHRQQPSRTRRRGVATDNDGEEQGDPARDEQRRAVNSSVSMPLNGNGGRHHSAKTPPTGRYQRDLQQPQQTQGSRPMESEQAQRNTDRAPHHSKVVGPGTVPAPRTWFIYPEKPPHITQLAWNSVTPETRKLHLRWLRELRGMPADLLDFPLQTAAVELAMRLHKARQLKWSTTAKSLSAICGALKHLDMYTTTAVTVDLMQFPEFESAINTAHRYERQEEKNPPAPVNQAQYKTAWHQLDTVSPVARVYLGLMWAFAARPSDIASIRCKDVILGQALCKNNANNSSTSTAAVPEAPTEILTPTSSATAATAAEAGLRHGNSTPAVSVTTRTQQGRNEDEHQQGTQAAARASLVDITVTMYENKGARFRGPYPVASQVGREDASVLQQLLQQRRPDQRLFAHADRCGTRIRAALRDVNPQAALPSVRKGAARHMAASGVPEEQIMRLTGHTKADTLRRYLGYGLQLTKEAETARANAARALHRDPRQ